MSAVTEMSVEIQRKFPLHLRCFCFQAYILYLIPPYCSYQCNVNERATENCVAFALDLSTKFIHYNLFAHTIQPNSISIET